MLLLFFLRTDSGMDELLMTDCLSAALDGTNPTKNKDKDAVVSEDKVLGLLTWSKLLS